MSTLNPLRVPTASRNGDRAPSRAPGLVAAAGAGGVGALLLLLALLPTGVLHGSASRPEQRATSTAPTAPALTVATAAPVLTATASPATTPRAPATTVQSCVWGPGPDGVVQQTCVISQ